MRSNNLSSNLIELIILVFIFADIFLDVLPIMALSFLLLPLIYVRVDKIGLFALCFYPLPILFGSIFYYYGIQGLGGYFQIFAALLFLYKWGIKKEYKIYNIKKAIIWMLLLFAVFAVSAFSSSGGNYAGEKLFLTVQYGIFAFIAYSIMFSNPHKCDFIRTGLYYIICAYLLLRISPFLNNGAGPSSFLDFGYLREYNSQFNSLFSDIDMYVIDYQHVGFFATLGLGTIMLHTLKGKLSPSLVIIGLFLCTLVSLYSGARQFIVISLVLVGLWVLMLIKKQRKGLSTFIIGVIALFFIWQLLGNLFSDEGLLSSIGEEGYLSGSGREFHLLKGISDFLENPIFGIGFGRFNLDGKYGRYPHNLFVELLCELGVVGTIAIIAIIIKPLIVLCKECKASLFLLFVYFLRSMTSGGLDSNIMLFGFIFASCCFLNDNNKKNLPFFRPHKTIQKTIKPV